MLTMQKQAMTPVDNAARTLSKSDRLPQPQRDDLTNASMIQRQVSGRFNGREEGLSARIRRMLEDLRNFKMDKPDAQKQMEDLLARAEAVRERNLGPAEQGIVHAMKGLENANDRGGDSPESPNRPQDQGAPPEPTNSQDSQKGAPGNTAKAETGKAEAQKADTGKADTGKSETGKADTRKADTGKSETGKAEQGKTDAGKADTAKSGTSKSAAAQPGASKSGSPKAGSPESGGEPQPAQPGGESEKGSNADQPPGGKEEAQPAGRRSRPVPTRRDAPSMRPSRIRRRSPTSCRRCSTT